MYDYLIQQYEEDRPHFGVDGGKPEVVLAQDLLPGDVIAVRHAGSYLHEVVLSRRVFGTTVTVDIVRIGTQAERSRVFPLRRVVVRVQDCTIPANNLRIAADRAKRKAERAYQDGRENAARLFLLH